MAKFETIEQTIVNYYVAKGIKAVIDSHTKDGNKKSEKDATYIVRKILTPQIKNKQLIELYSNIVDFVEVNVLTSAIASCAIEAMEKYRFEDSNSITTVTGDNKHLEDSFDYKILSKINLQDHTLHVVQWAMKNCKEEHPTTKTDIILGCLLHDFGKETEIRKICQSRGSKVSFHASVSSFFVKELLLDSVKDKIKTLLSEDIASVVLEGLQKKILKIAKMVNDHHIPKALAKGALKKVKEADIEARQQEVTMLKETKKE